MMKKSVFTLLAILMIFLTSTLFSYAADPGITIISPSITSSNNVIYCDNLLISLKVAQGKSLRISLLTDAYGLTEKNRGMVVYGPEKFTSDQQINFFTAQVDGVKPGIYWLMIETLDGNGSVINTTDKYFCIREAKAKKTAPATDLYNTPNSNTLNFFQSVFKNLFGDESTASQYGVIYYEELDS